MAAVAAALALTAACAPAIEDLPATLSATGSGLVRFATPESLRRQPDLTLATGPPVTLSGELTLPAGRGPFGAVVLAHGCAGPGNVERGWAAALGAAGYATLVLDSFGGRGLTEVCSSAWSLTAFQRLPDAYGALRILSTHPGIDARRIALMGFSHGGGLTVGAATVWARERYASGGRAVFRAFLPFYPSCNGTAPELDAISAPLRIHIGELDDWTPSTPCRERVAALRARGYDADVTVYPGAHHAFDDVGRPVTRLARVDNSAACRPRARSILGPLASPEDLVGCLKKGATIGWSREATDRARDNVRRELADLLD